MTLERFEEAKSLLRKAIPVARRGIGESHELTLKMRWIYAKALYNDPGATLDDLREAVTTLEDLERTARRVLGGAHPLTGSIEIRLREARAALAARDGGVSAIREGDDGGSVKLGSSADSNTMATRTPPTRRFFFGSRTPTQRLAPTPSRRREYDLTARETSPRAA